MKLLNRNSSKKLDVLLFSVQLKSILLKPGFTKSEILTKIHSHKVLKHFLPIQIRIGFLIVKKSL